MKGIMFFLAILTISLFSLYADTDEYLEITNETGFTIAAIFISDSDEDDWGVNYLDGKFLEDGETLRVSMVTLGSTLINVRGRDDEGDTYTVFGIEVSSDDVLLTLNDIDPD